MYWFRDTVGGVKKNQYWVPWLTIAKKGSTQINYQGKPVFEKSTHGGTWTSAYVRVISYSWEQAWSLRVEQYRVRGTSNQNSINRRRINRANRAGKKKK